MGIVSKPPAQRVLLAYSTRRFWEVQWHFALLATRVSSRKLCVHFPRASAGIVHRASFRFVVA